MPVYPSMPYAPPSYYGYRGGDNISALLMRQGEIAAQGAQRSGDIWGHVVENLGNIAGNYVQQRNEQKQGEKRQAAFQDALSTWDDNDPKGSTMRLARVIGPQDALKFGAGLTEIQAQAAKQKQGQAPDMKGLANVVGMVKVYKDVHGDEGLAQAWSNYGHILAPYANLIAPGQDISQYRPEYGKLIDSLDERMNPKAQGDETVVLGNALVNRKTGKTIATAPEKAEKPSVQALDTTTGKPVFITPTQAADPRYQPMRAGVNVNLPGAEDNAPSLTPAGMDMAAEMFAKTGQLPPMGMGKQGAAVRQKIINRAAELHPGADIAGNKAGFEANKASLGSMQKMVDSVSAFESTASKNAKILDGLLDKIPDFGTSFANLPARALAKKFGSEDMASFNTIRQSVANEYARIISNPNLSGVMSDSAREEGAVLLDPNATAGQIRAAIKTLAAEAKNRHTEYQGQLDSIRGRISGKQETTKTRYKFNPATGELE